MRNDWTTITTYVKAVYEQLAAIEENLKKNERKVSIIINVGEHSLSFKEENEDDGLQLFIDAMKALESLSVDVTIILGETMIPFLNVLDSELERSKIVPGHLSEANEIGKYQKWLNYSTHLHRCRKFGCTTQELEVLNKRKLTVSEMRNYCEFLFDEDFPDPTDDWAAFTETLQHAMEYEHEQWNPLKRKLMPWIDIKKLTKEYYRKGNKASAGAKISR